MRVMGCKKSAKKTTMCALKSQYKCLLSLIRPFDVVYNDLQHLHTSTIFCTQTSDICAGCSRSKSSLSPKQRRLKNVIFPIRKKN